MMPEEKAELAGLLEEKMLRREAWPKIEVMREKKTGQRGTRSSRENYASFHP
jgi:hypothetical protein